ncbi:hypothetical protein [Tenacibaculum sp. C7A-26P2]|uniref:hypothetical protein n=1 Tax=Tenacibaculum sp. C7A-26P2 TaxID=3447504 RepID=UPI003F8644CE
MKKIKLNYLFLLLALLILSCEDSDNEIANEPNNEIIDNYKLLAVSDLGEVFEIGNNTGNIENVGQLNKENESTFLFANNLISSEEKIYSIEYVYNPLPTNNLLVFDRENGTSQIIPLILPPNINGNEKAIIALAWDNNNLIGVLAENVFINNSTKHIIKINLQDNSITDLGITFNEGTITSMKKINSKLFLSTRGEGFIEINLTDNSINNLNSINGSKLAQINNSELAIMQSVTGSANGAKPSVINLTNQTISDKSNGETYLLSNVFGNSFYKDNVYLNLVKTNSIYLGILKSNYETNENTIVEINSTAVNRNLIIVNTIE